LQPLSSQSLLIRKIPIDELAVYLLFGELVGRGILPGWQFIYVSGSATYDGAMKFEIDLSDNNSVNNTASGSCLYGPGIQLIIQEDEDHFMGSSDKRNTTFDYRM